MRRIATTILLALILPAAAPLLAKPNHAQTSASNTVYICTGPHSKAYHRTSNCRGLNKCSGSIKAISVSEAVARNRKPCGICYR